MSTVKGRWGGGFPTLTQTRLLNPLSRHGSETRMIRMIEKCKRIGMIYTHSFTFIYKNLIL